MGTSPCSPICFQFLVPAVEFSNGFLIQTTIDSLKTVTHKKRLGIENAVNKFMYSTTSKTIYTTAIVVYILRSMVGLVAMRYYNSIVQLV